jgi:hypothetical protein
LPLSQLLGVTAKPLVAGSCDFGQMDIPHSENKFNALQFHIHAYSEHAIVGKGTVDGSFFPFELHVVHQESTKESFAVFGTMISVVGDEEHAMFEQFLRGWEAAAQTVEDECGSKFKSTMVQQKIQCPKIGTKTISTFPIFDPEVKVDVYDFPTDKDFGVFTYKGGLTTPDCLEVVNWNLLDVPMVISEGQAERLDFLILCYVDNSDGICDHGTVADEAGGTSRPPQDLQGRKVLHRCPDGLDITVPDIGVLSTPTNCPGSVIDLSSATAEASSQESGTRFSPDKAIDGNMKTRWSSAFKDAQMFTVDLGVMTRIDALWLNWEEAHTMEYDVQILDSDDKWVTIFDIDYSNGKVDALVLAVPVVTQHVRLDLKERATVWGNSLWEFQVRGTQDLSCEEPVKVLR